MAAFGGFTPEEATTPTPAHPKGRFPCSVIVYTASGDGHTAAGRHGTPEAVNTLLNGPNTILRDPLTLKSYKWGSKAWKTLDVRLAHAAWHVTPRNCTIMEAEGALSFADRPYGTAKLNKQPTVGRLKVQFRPCDTQRERDRQALLAKLRLTNPHATIPPLRWQCGVAVVPNRGGEGFPPGADIDGIDRDAARSMLAGTAEQPVRVLIRGRKGDALWTMPKREHTSKARKKQEEAEFGDAARAVMKSRSKGGKDERMDWPALSAKTAAAPSVYVRRQRHRAPDVSGEVQPPGATRTG
ncbi:hypothetical protein T484DRAFT_1822869 [Baffinella frigidus]|nr:hypothetical protein T484DRAFT_1822869 [Cryptophyta sp. CCMP2293]